MGPTSRESVGRVLRSLSELTHPTASAALSRRLGATPDSTARLVAAAVPLVLVAVARRASTSTGADLLVARLTRLARRGGEPAEEPDDEDALDREAEGLLGHLLGGRRSAIEAFLSRRAEADRTSARRVLALVVAELLESLREIRCGADEPVVQLSREVGAALARAEDRVPGAVGAFEELLAEGETDEDPVDLGGRLLEQLSPA